MYVMSMFQLSSKYFYKRHFAELKRYTNINNKNIHLINNSTKLIDTNKNLEYKYIDLTEDVYEQIYNIKEKYDLIVISDLFEFTDDIFKLLAVLKQNLLPQGKILISSINYKWKFIMGIIEVLNLKNKNKNKSISDLKKLEKTVYSIGLHPESYFTRQIFPFRFFKVGDILNNILEFLFSFFNFGIKNYLLLSKVNENKKIVLSKSVIIPAKNEEKNLEPLIRRIPKFKNIEIFLICGNSHDNTLTEALRLSKIYNDLNITVIEQLGNGKSGAVYQGLENVNNDIIAILDSDLSVDPEALTDFFDIIESGKAEFVNGTRFFYLQEKNAMRFLNTIGNRVFQKLVSVLTGEPLTDSLCGTKVFTKKFIDDLKFWRNYINFKDPFGDFDLIFTASFTGKKITEHPVHYRSRTYGTTQISRFKDGWKLLIYFFKSFFIFKVSKN